MATLPLSIPLKAPNGVEYVQPIGLFINNEFVTAKSGQRIATIDPTNETVIAEVHAGGVEDIDAAVDAARMAFNGSWRSFTATARGRLLSKLADLVEGHAETLATIETWDNGKPYQDALQYDVAEVISVFRYYAGYADKLHGQVIETENNQHVYTIREPLGVCGQIIPWNYPLSMAAWKLGPAIATGNCVVLKPAEQTPLSVLFLATLVKKAGYPAGVVNIVNGYGRTAGAALAGHLGVNKVAFTGSTETGRQIMKLASSNMKNISLETGGKSPLIVFQDADLEKAVYWAHIGVMANAGQVCTANSRIFVHESVHGKFIKLLARQVESAKIGDPFDSKTFQGPQVSQEHASRILKYIDIGKTEGATPITGGDSWKDSKNGKGYYVQPTIFTNVQDDMRICQEEIFGPVAVVLSFKSENEAISRANKTQFGLGAALFTKDVSLAHRVARRIESGVVWVNSSNDSDIRAPFGGVKQSGIGRECGEAGIHAYTALKTIYVTLDIPSSSKL